MNNLIPLEDGRQLAIAEYGDPRGKPVLLFHGIPGSRIFRPPDEITKRLRVRLITIDRPGYGLSTYQPGRHLLDWPKDILQIADQLKLDRFAVSGHSGGGPYVLACAHRIAQRLTHALVLSGVGPLNTPEATRGMWWMNRIGFLIGRWTPWPLWHLLVWLFFNREHNDPETIMERGAASRPSADAKLMSQPEIRDICYKSEVEALQQGTRGSAWEARLVCRPWGFRLEDIQMTVHLWHGTDDRETPISMGRYVASRIPHCIATFCEGEGHLLLFPHWEEILTQAIS